MAQGWLRRFTFRIVAVAPWASRPLAAKLGYGEIVDQLVAMRQPPQWRMEAAPDALAAWRRLLSARRSP